MKVTYIPIFFILFFLLGNGLLAQQQSMYTQYMFNGLAINPAYAGSHESLSLTALARKQWVGMNGAPSTQTFAAHTPVKNEKVGLGLLLSHDNIGVTNQYFFNLAYSYRVKVGAGKLCMGIQGGVSNYNQALTQLYIGPNATDPSFSQDIQTYVPNVGGGFYYYTNRFYLGASSPQLITYNTNTPEGVYFKQSRHYFVNAGYVFDLNSSLKLKPNALLKVVEGAPIQVDFNANLLIKEVLWVGGGYRSFEAASALIQLQITDQLRFGYAYDFPVGSSFNRLSAGSHELMLNYSFTFYKSKYSSPRHF